MKPGPLRIRAALAAWLNRARPEQLLPPGDWLVFLILAGRGWGKSRAGAEAVAMWLIDRPGCRVALVAATFDDGRDTMVEGEALALGTLVPTPDGYTTMGDLREGDTILGGDGLPCRVTRAFPVLHGRPCFTVFLKGGVEIVADGQHKWLTEDYRTRAYTRRHGSTRRAAQVVTTDDLRSTLRAAAQANHGIRVSAAAYSGADGLIPPYVLGAWLGDGTSKAGAITSADPEMLEHFEAEGYAITNHRGNGSKAATYGVLGLQAQLRALGLLRNKHVPMSYLRASPASRLALLQGLMDTDGYVSVRGQCEFVNKNKLLADAVVDLAAGLGMKPSAPRPKLTNLGTTHWLVKFTTTQPVFRLARKMARVPLAYRDERHWFVKDVRPTESVPVRCIEVNSADRTFLVTRHHVRTHNSGLLGVLDRYGVAYTWNRSLGQLIVTNGSRADLYSGEKPRQLRGPQHHYALCDEMAWWLHPRATWDNLLFGLRLGERPRVIVTTTPRPLALLGELVAAHDTVLSQGSTMDNAANLPEVILDKLLEQYDGTELGKQELYGVLSLELAGALWSRAVLAGAHTPYPLPVLERIVVSVDPAVTSGQDSDATGLAVVGRGPAPIGWQPPPGAVDKAVAMAAPHLYVLHSEQDRWTPTEAMTRALELLLLYGADEVVVEVNNGGDYLGAVLLAVADAAGVTVKLRTVTATKNKVTRAEPTVALYQQRRAHHVGKHEALEDQLVSYTGASKEASPDMMDALVWAQARLIPLDVKAASRRGRKRVTAATVG